MEADEYHQYLNEALKLYETELKIPVRAIVAGFEKK
jgi:hypothetical protein